MPEERQPKPITLELDERLAEGEKFLEGFDWISHQTYVNEIQGADKKRAPADLSEEEKENVSDKIYDSQINAYINEYLGFDAKTAAGKRRALRTFPEDSGYGREKFVDALSKTKMSSGDLDAIVKEEIKGLNKAVIEDTFIDLTSEQIEQLKGELVSKAESCHLEIDKDKVKEMKRNKVIGLYSLLKGIEARYKQNQTIITKYLAENQAGLNQYIDEE